MADEETNRKGVTHDDGFEVGIVLDIGRVGDLEVEEGKGAAEGTDRVGEEGPHVVDERVVHESVNTAILRSSSSVSEVRV